MARVEKFNRGVKMRDEKMGKVMSEFKHGKLHSSSGDMVSSRKQAIAIAMSEAGMSKKRKKKRKKA